MARRKLRTYRFDVPPIPGVLARRWRAWRAGPRDPDAPRRVLFFPEPPKPKAAILKVLAHLGWLVETDPGKPCDLAFRWQDRTWAGVPRVLRALQDVVPVLNLHGTDISKRAVSAAFAEVFGRALAVDPSTHQGPMVEKSDRNAKHDGRVVEGPIDSPVPGRVYLRLIDNRVEDDAVEDLRAVVVFDEIPHVYAIRRPAGARFENPNTSVYVRETDAVFSKAEQAQLLALARRLCVDVGEFDTLRDGPGGDLYVVDLANTPFGPPNAIEDDEREKAVASFAASLRRGLAQAGL